MLDGESSKADMARRRNQINLRLRQATRLIENVSTRVKYVTHLRARRTDLTPAAILIGTGTENGTEMSLLRQRLLSRTASYDRKLQSKFKRPEFNATRIIDNMGE